MTSDFPPPEFIKVQILDNYPSFVFFTIYILLQIFLCKIDANLCNMVQISWKILEWLKTQSQPTKLAQTVSYDEFPSGGESHQKICFLLWQSKCSIIFDNGVSTERGRGQRGLGNLCMMKVELGLLVGGMTWHDGWSKKVGLAPIFTSYPPLFTPMCPI